MTSIALSDSDILGALSKLNIKARVVEFKDICAVKTADELFSEGAVVVYIGVEPGFGHWACAWLKKGQVHTFDSSGHALDQDLLEISPATRAELHETSPCLMDLLLDPRRCPYPVVVSGWPLQACKPGINTCGRWVIARLQHADLSDDQFHALLEKSKTSPGESFDTAVVALTHGLLGK